MLPPSLIAGPAINDTASISYHLRVVAKLLVQGRTEKETLSASEPVTVMSLAEELPPLETRDFPAEYVESMSNPIRTSLIGTSLGTMTISTHEPPALSYNLTASGGSTVLTFQVDLDAAENSEIHRRLRAMVFVVEGVIRMKTFRSTAPFPKLPSQGLLTSRGKIRLLDQVLKLETRTVGNCGWHYGPDNEMVSTKTQAKSSSRSASVSEPYPSNKLITLLRSMNISEPSVASPAKGTWRTKFNVPIHIISRLTPTFCSPLVARFYSLILRLKIQKASSKVYELEVPVQVVYLPQTPTQPFGGLSTSSDRARPPFDADTPGAGADSGTDRGNVVRFSWPWPPQPFGGYTDGRFQETEEILPTYNA